MKPIVSLINWTPKPIATMAYVRRIMHSSVPSSLEEFEKDPEKWLGMNCKRTKEDDESSEIMERFP